VSPFLSDVWSNSSDILVYRDGGFGDHVLEVLGNFEAKIVISNKFSPHFFPQDFQLELGMELIFKEK